MADATEAVVCRAGGCRVDGGEEESEPRMDAIGTGGCGIGGCRVDGVEEDNGPKMDIVTSTYTG